MVNLLQHIKNGNYTFKAESSFISDLQDFENIVKQLKNAEENGFIEVECYHRESFSGERFIDSILIKKLTAIGEKFIAQRHKN